MRALPGRLVLLGHPVAHSLSPRFQNAALRHAGIPLRYEPLDVAPAHLEATVRALRSSDGAGNVTIPHKQAVAAHCDELTPAAARAGAVNTFWVDGGRLIGDNTDVGGFEAVVAQLFSGARGAARPEVVAILGAGGAAAGVLVALERWPRVRVRIFNRTVYRAEALCARFARIAQVAASAAEAVRDAHLVVNATSIGLSGDAVPLDTALIGAEARAIDLVYRPGGTAWVRALVQRGIRAVDGTTMLLEQGALAFERWFGFPPDRDAMRAALLDD